MDKYIYCENDFIEAMRGTLGEMFKDDLNEFIVEKVIKNLKEHVNLYRFYARNCAGCVAGNDECDFAYGRGKAEGCWEKAVKGELFDCPVRTNGTLAFSREEGFRDVDISDRDKPPYPIIKKEEHNGR